MPPGRGNLQNNLAIEISFTGELNEPCHDRRSVGFQRLICLWHVWVKTLGKKHAPCGGTALMSIWQFVTSTFTCRRKGMTHTGFTRPSGILPPVSWHTERPESPPLRKRIYRAKFEIYAETYAFLMSTSWDCDRPCRPSSREGRSGSMRVKHPRVTIPLSEMKYARGLCSRRNHRRRCSTQDTSVSCTITSWYRITYLGQLQLQKLASFQKDTCTPGVCMLTYLILILTKALRTIALSCWIDFVTRARAEKAFCSTSASLCLLTCGNRHASTNVIRVMDLKDPLAHGRICSDTGCTGRYYDEAIGTRRSLR